ncbi:MAG: class I SAM-dependent methyltransferase [Pseudonocardiaceae bacterium]
MNRLAMRLLDAGFGHPSGILGRIGGALMAWGNGEQERWAVEQAGLGPGDRVLAVGHGPGLGVQLAARAVAPGGQVVGVDPSAVMRQMATARCSGAVADGVVELREGTAERTGCEDASMDAVISVNNVMLWDLAAGFAELVRVLRPGGRLVVTVHRIVLDVEPEQLRDEAAGAGLVDLTVAVNPRQRNERKVELLARRP